MMPNFVRSFALTLFAAMWMCGSTALGQIVINEFVYNNNPASSPDEREFLELYNAGATAVDISGWDIVITDELGEFSRDTIPASSSIAPGDYYVIADATNVPNVDFDIGFFDIWPNANNILELQNASDTTVDAFAYEINKNNGVEWRTAAQLAETGPFGFWGNTVVVSSTDQSLSRYLDGRDTNVNGRDFGLIPATPGTSNNLPQVGAYVLPDISGVAIGDFAPDMTGTFVGARVVDPTVVGPDLGAGTPENPAAVAASPSGGKVFSAWDASGGGNAVTGDALITSYNLNVYLNTDDLGTSGDESTTYGIGTALSFYNQPDPSGFLGTGPFTANGNTGIGWLYEKEDSNSLKSLKLIDFGAGGESTAGAGQDWVVVQDIDLSAFTSGWYGLSLEFDPTTGNVTAVFDGQTFNFTTSTDLIGTFYAGYRERIDQSSFGDKLRPALFEQASTSTADDADFNDDTDVDGGDFLAWQRNFETTDGTALSTDGDATGEGDVTAADLAVWLSEFGSTVPAPFASVPEPTGMALVSIAAGLLFSSRRRKLGL